jgi:hypothetical protein
MLMIRKNEIRLSNGIKQANYRGKSPINPTMPFAQKSFTITIILMLPLVSHAKCLQCTHNREREF